MAALANRFWECPPQDEAEDEDNKGVKQSHQDDDKKSRIKVEEEVTEQRKEVIEEYQMIENQIPDAEMVKEAELVLDREEDEEVSREICQVEGDLQWQEQEEEKQVLNEIVILEEDEQSVEFSDPENEENENECVLEEDEVKEEVFDAIGESRSRLSCSSVASQHKPQEQEAGEEVEEKEPPLEKILQEETVNTTTQEPEDPKITQKPETGQESKEKEGQKPQQNLLPDCLLLMMCEPKLSMEVSRETWVCSTDFIRWERKPLIPEVNKTDGCDETNRRISIDSKPPQLHRNNQPLMQPPRSSCSFPAAPPLPPTHSVASMNTQIAQKLGEAKQAYEPFVLTRCKSEPMRMSAKFAPENCCWKNRKLEPHGPGAVGVGAGGVGF